MILLRIICVVCTLAALVGTSAAQEGSLVLNGVVRDPTGATVRGAEVQVLGVRQRLAGSAATDAQGRFSIAVSEPGAYVVEIRAPGFADTRTSVSIPLAGAQLLELTTGSPTLYEDVSVTASIDSAEPISRLTQPVNVIDASEIQLRAKAVVSQVANEEVGLHVQRTSPVMAGIFVRGLTGNKVNVFVDGVRYSTAAQRGGVNTFLDLIDPALLDSVEVLRGPNSAQYGSDALGGSLQFLSRVPSIGGGRRFGGVFAAAGNSADSSVGSNVTASYAGSRVGVIGALAGRRIDDLRPGPAARRSRVKARTASFSSPQRPIPSSYA
jgi:hemoglobin/transferrin/lactoferrin receptor protein